jgi:hypothetical protein
METMLIFRQAKPVDTDPYDRLGHGTHVASIAAGAGIGDPVYKGVAPGANLVVASLGDYAIISRAIGAIDWMVNEYNPSQTDPAKKARILSMSFGTYDPDDPDGGALSLAVQAAIDSGVVAVAGAGNEGPEQQTVAFSPGGVEDVITVGSIYDEGEDGIIVSDFSSRGPTLDGRIKPDIMAPGSNIMAAKVRTSGGYIEKSGTSMSTPFIAGTVALMLQENLALTPAEVTTILMDTAKDWGPAGKDNDYGAGVVDVFAAVDAADGDMGSISGLAVPAHFSAFETLAAVNNKDQWNLPVNDISYPIAVTLIMPDWIDSRNPNFNIILYDSRGRKVAWSRSSTRQDILQYMPSKTGDYTLEVSSRSGSGAYFFDVSAGASGLTLLSDDDAGDMHDVAISQIAVASSVAPGITDVDVLVNNLGAYGETTTVVLKDLTDPSTIVTAPQSITVSAGSSRTVTFSWDTTTSSTGTHVLEAEVAAVTGETNTSNNLKQKSVDVVQVQGALSVAVATDKAAYSIGEKANIIVEVTDASNLNFVEGAAVHIDITTAKGKKYGKDGVTDASGLATFTFKIKVPDGSGTYTVDANATKAGYVTGSGTTIFVVN